MPDISSPLSIEPAKPPTLSYRIARAIDALRGRFPEPQTPDPKPTSAPTPPDGVKSQDDPMGRGFVDANYVSAWYRQYEQVFQYGVNRARRYADYSDMDVSQIAAMLDAIVDSCLVSDDGEVVGFKVEAKSNKYQSVIDQVNKDLDLTFNIRFILRDLLKYGDNWIGLILDDKWNIVDYENPPAKQMYTFVDERNRLLTGTETLDRDGTQILIPRAYQQKTSALQTVAGWYPWEMFHLKYYSSKQSVYSTKSFLEDMRADYYKLRMIEESLVITRITRAAPRNVHTLDVTGKSPEEARTALDEYVKGITQKKLSNNQYVKDTLAVDEDLFITNQMRQSTNGLEPSLNSINTIDPRLAGLQRLPDVDYLVRKLFSRIPSEIVGILPDRNDITSQDIAASRFYLYLQTILEKQLLRPIYNLALTLRGYKPEPDDYQIIFPNVQMRSSWRLADSRFRTAMGNGENINNSVVSRQFIAQQEFGFTDTEWEKQKEIIKKEQAEFGAIPNATKPALVRKGEKGTSPESNENPPASFREQAQQSIESLREEIKREQAEQMLPLLKEMRELREQLLQKSHNLTVNFPEQAVPQVHVNVPPSETKIQVPATQVVIENKMPEQVAPVIHVAAPEIPPAQITVNVPEQPAPVVSNTLNLPEQFAHIDVHVPETQLPTPIVNVQAPQVNVENVIPEQAAPVVNNVVNVPEQNAPTIQNVVNVPETQLPAPIVNIEPAQVTVENKIPEQAAPIVNIEPAQVNVNVPEQPAPQVDVHLPEAQSPIVNVQPAQVTVENLVPATPTPNIIVNVPENPTPQVNLNLPSDAIKVEVEATVDLPDEEETLIQRDAMGKTVGFKKKRKYTRRKKKEETESVETSSAELSETAETAPDITVPSE